MNWDNVIDKMEENKKMKELRFLAKAWSLDHPGDIYDVDKNNPAHSSKWFRKKFTTNLEMFKYPRFDLMMNHLTSYNRIKFKLAQQKEVAREQREDPRFKELADQIDKNCLEIVHLKQQNETLTALVMLLSKKLELDVPTEKECHICHKNKE